MSYREGAEIGRSMMGMAQSYATIQRMGNERKRMQWEEEDRPIKQKREAAQENRAVARFDWDKGDRETSKKVYALATEYGKTPDFDASKHGYDDDVIYKAKVLYRANERDEYALSEAGRQDRAQKIKAEHAAAQNIINDANAMMAGGDTTGAQTKYLEFAQKHLWQGYLFEDMGDGNLKLTPTEEGAKERIIPKPSAQEMQQMATAYMSDPKAWLSDRLGGVKRIKEGNSLALITADYMYDDKGNRSPYRTATVRDPATGLAKRVFIDPLDPEKEMAPSDADLKKFSYTGTQAEKVRTRVEAKQEKTEKKTGDEKKRRDDLTKAAIVEYNKAQKAFMENVGADGTKTGTEEDFAAQNGTREEYIADYLTSFGYEKAKQPKRLINPDTKITAQTMAQLDKLPDAEAEKEIRRASPQQRAQIIKLRSGVKETTGKEKVQTTIKSEKQEKAANKPTPEESAKIEARAKELEKEYEIPHEKAVKLATNEVMNLKLPEEVKKAMETVAKWGKSGKVDVRQEMGTGWNK